MILISTIFSQDKDCDISGFLNVESIVGESSGQGTPEVTETSMSSPTSAGWMMDRSPEIEVDVSGDELSDKASK